MAFFTQRVYEGGGTLDNAAVFQGKKGTPKGVDLIGLEGTEGRHWTIARQGNYVIWGIDPDFDKITEAGAHLFLNLCFAMSQTAAQ